MTISGSMTIYRLGWIVFKAVTQISFSQETNSGLNSEICRANFSILRPAPSATTLKSPSCSTTLRVLQPIDPVEPKMEINFIKYRLQISTNQAFSLVFFDRNGGFC